MGDYFNSMFMADAPKSTYNFTGGWKPDAFVIDLGTNDMRVIKTNNSQAAHTFTTETVDFMKSVSTRYQSPNMHFFLTTGPMENTTMLATQNAVTQVIVSCL